MTLRQPKRRRSPSRTGPRIRIRQATERDLDVLVSQRRRMWYDMGERDTKRLDDADRVYRAWARSRLRRHRLIAFLAESPLGRVVAGGCVWLQVVHPRPGFPGGDQPYLLSMTTDPEFRGRGLAARIVREAVRWCRRQGFPRITLHASVPGRSLYARMGFERTWEMRLDLDR